MAKMSESRYPLPTGWRWVRLGELVREALPGFASGARDPHGVIQLRMNNVDTNGNMVWNEFLRVPADPETIAKYQLAVGDVAFNNTNSTALVGKSALFGGYSEPVVYSNHFTRLRTLPERLTPDYLAAWLVWQWQLHVFADLCNQWIGQSAVQSDKLLALEIPLPSLAEQRRIAAILNEQMAAVERARAAAETQLAAARELPTAYLREVFDTREAAMWQKEPLGSLSVVGPDNGIFKRRIDFGIGVPIINVADLYRGLAVDLTKVERVNASVREMERYAVEAGDLFFCRSSLKREGVGWCCYVREVDEPTVFDCHVMRVRLNRSRAQPEFVAHYWLHPDVRAEVIGKSKTATMTTMSQGDLASVKIPVPPVQAQARIASILREQHRGVSQLQTSIQLRLNTINQLPAALLRRAFSGGL